MARLVTVTLDLDALPASIAKSIKAVLDQHDLALVRHSDTTAAWDGARLDKVLRELGRNAAGALVLADESEAAA